MWIFKCILETDGCSHRCPDVLTKVVNWAELLYLTTCMSPSCGKLHVYKSSDSSGRTGIQSPSVSDPCVLSLGTWETTETWASDIHLK